jgi:RNA polymerase sigma-70 factor (ECF subfamily)
MAGESKNVVSLTARQPKPPFVGISALVGTEELRGCPKASGLESPERTYAREVPLIRNYLARLGVARQDREDCAQEVFARVLAGHMAHHSADQPLRPWLQGVAFRVAMEARRRARRESDPTYRVFVPRAPLPADALLDRDRRMSLLLLAIERISLPRRTLFIMSEFEGYSMPEIASILSLPLNTAYSRLRLAREEVAAEVRHLGIHPLRATPTNSAQ